MDNTFYAKFRRHKSAWREPLASPTSHRRLLKRLLHPFDQKSPHDSETPRTSKRSSSTPSDSSDNSGDGVLVCSDTGYRDHQLVKVDSEPAILRFLDRIAQRLKLELDLDGNDGQKTHGSNQKRPADNHDQGSCQEKKQKQGQRSRNTGGGGGGGGKKNGGGNGGKQPPDGHRYPVPPPHSGPQKKPPFACPFHKFDPVRYECCSSVRPKRLCDVSLHLKRCHLLGEVKQKTANAEHADNADPADNVELVGNAEAEEEVAFYCSKCRVEFFGITAEAKLRQHLPCQTPKPATIEQTGMLLPAEHRQLVAARKKASGDIPKWHAMWKACLPNRPVPESPYFPVPGQEAVVEASTVLPEDEVETLAPRSQGREVIRRAINDCPSHHFFTKDEIDTIVDQVLNGIYSRAEPQTGTDPHLEVQQRQMPQRQIFQQQISQQPLNGAATSTVFEPSTCPAAPKAYPPSYQLYQNPSAPTPRVVPQTNALTQKSYYGTPCLLYTSRSPHLRQLQKLRPNPDTVTLLAVMIELPQS